MSRWHGFKAAEDVLLCSAYLAIVQDPIIGKNQTKKNLWKRISELYNERKEPTWEERNNRSCECRIQKIEKHVKKLMACIRHIENNNPSGASDADIMVRAKMLMQTDNGYKGGFKYDHVWEVMKDFVKFEDNVQTARRKARAHMVSYVSSSSENQTPHNPIDEVPSQQSPGLSDFSINLNQSFVGVGSSERPIGIKKAKKKKAMDAEIMLAVHKREEQNERMCALIEKSNEIRSKHLQWKERELEVRNREAEAKNRESQATDRALKLQEDAILMIDTSKILDPLLRNCMMQRQTEIIQSRMMLQTQAPTPSSTPNLNIDEEYTYINNFVHNANNVDFPDY